MVGCPEKKLETALGNEEVVGVVVLGDVGTRWRARVVFVIGANYMRAVIFFRTTIIYYHTGCADCCYVFL